MDIVTVAIICLGIAVFAMAWQVTGFGKKFDEARNAGYNEAFRYFLRGKRAHYSRAKVKLMAKQMALFQLEKPRAYARAGHPQTSWEAANAFSAEELTGLQAEILLELFENGGGTHEEIARRVGRNPFLSTTRTRVAELCDMGLVKATDERRPTLSTHEDCSIVWRLATREEIAAILEEQMKDTIAQQMDRIYNEVRVP